MSAWLDSWDSFIKVVESGSMAGAARRLGCSRAQVSRQIGQLEAALGVHAKVRLVEPGATPRSEGKAVRVIDHRKKG